MPDDAPADEHQRRTRLRSIVASARSQAAGSRVAARDGSRSRISADDPIASSLSPSPFLAGALPRYQILREVHRGGQGVVYEAMQQSTKRRVAIKVMREGPFASLGEMARFDREVEILAQLNHPNIVTIHDSGQAAGHFYLVMDYVSGRPLDEYIEAQRDKGTEGQEGHAPPGNELRACLHLFAKICEAVNVAHARGIIHRDLKPSNIRVDDQGNPHVLDFGLARTASTEHFTQTGQFVGSLPWASPEQAEGAAHRMDIRSDVYSLGAVLYQILTGRLPHELTDNLHDMLGRILRADVRPPSAFNRAIDSDLEVIVLKCLHKDPDRRYASAGELGRDMGRYLRGDAIDARRDSGWYVIRKTLRRHRVPVAIVTAFIVMALASTIALSIMYHKQTSLLGEVSRQRDKAVAAENVAEAHRRQAECDSYFANIAAADAAIAVNDGGTAMLRLQQTPAALRNWEWRFLARCADPSIATLQGPESFALTQVFFSPSARYVGAFAARENAPVEFYIWDWARAKLVVHSRRPDFKQAARYEFTSDERSVDVFLADGRMIRYGIGRDAEDEQSVAGANSIDTTTMIVQSGSAVGYRVVDSRYIAYYWRLHDPAHRGEIHLDPATSAAGAIMTPDGQWFALVQSDGGIWISNTTPGTKPTKVTTGSSAYYGIDLRSDGRRLAVGFGDGVIRQWELVHDGSDNGVWREAKPLQGSVQRVVGVSHSPDGAALAAASADKTVRIWRIADGELLALLRGHSGPVSAVAFSPDSTLLASGALDSTLKIWKLNQPSATLVRRDLQEPIGRVEFNADGSRLLVVTGSQIMLLDALNGQTQTVMRALPHIDRGVLLRDGRRITSGCYDGTVRTFDLPSGRELQTLRYSAKNFIRIALNPSESELAWSDPGTENMVVLCDPISGHEIRRLDHPGLYITSLAYSPDGSVLATGAESGQVYFWNPASGHAIWTGRPHSGAIMDIAFSLDGLQVAVASTDTTVSIMDVRTGAIRFTLRPRIGDVWCAAFSRDGTRLAIGGRDRSVRIFDSADGREIFALRGPTGTIISLAWSPDGQRMAAGSWANEVFIWDAGQPDQVAN